MTRHNGERVFINAQMVAFRSIGDRVFVVADNFGEPAIIVDTRESTQTPASHYKVRTDSGDEFWAFDFEVSDV